MIAGRRNVYVFTAKAITIRRYVPTTTRKTIGKSTAVGEQEPQSTTSNNSVIEREEKKGMETLPLSKQIKVVNPNRPGLQEEALALFDIGSQLFFISKDLTKRLKLSEVEEEVLTIVSFGNRIPKSKKKSS